MDTDKRALLNLDMKFQDKYSKLLLSAPLRETNSYSDSATPIKQTSVFICVYLCLIFLFTVKITKKGGQNVHPTRLNFYAVYTKTFAKIGGTVRAISGTYT